MNKTESHQKLEQIRKARDGEQSENNSPEILACPICGATVFRAAPLRSHVANSEDRVHAAMELDENLEPIAVGDWGPGAPS